MRMHGAGDQRRGGISWTRREGGRRTEEGGKRGNREFHLEARDARQQSAVLPSFPPSLLPSYTTHDVANYAIKAACKFLPLFTKGGGGGGGSWRDKEGGKSQDNNLFVKIAESGEKRSPREISSRRRKRK